jgi:hypothetical protein
MSTLSAVLPSGGFICCFLIWTVSCFVCRRDCEQITWLRTEAGHTNLLDLLSPSCYLPWTSTRSDPMSVSPSRGHGGGAQLQDLRLSLDGLNYILSVFISVREEPSSMEQSSSWGFDNLSRSSPHFMEPVGYLPHSQDPTTGTFPFQIQMPRPYACKIHFSAYEMRWRMWTILIDNLLLEVHVY